MSLSSITLFPLENITLNAVPILGLVLFMLDILFFPLFLNSVGRICKHLSRSQSSIKSQLCFCDDLKAQILKESPEFDLSEKIKEDGQICREDVEMVMNELGIFCHPGGEKLQERLVSDDLLDMFEEKEPSLEEVKGAFDVFDENRDGFIDARELQRVLCNLGFKQGLELDKCRRMIGTYDHNGDGRIDFNEFVKFMENTFC